jgi:hypothetical protein
MTIVAAAKAHEIPSTVHERINLGRALRRARRSWQPAQGPVTSFFMKAR